MHACGRRRARIAALVVGGTAAAVLGVVWLDGSTLPQPMPPVGPAAVGPSSGAAADAAASGSDAVRYADTAGTGEVGADPLLAPELRGRIDALWLDIGEVDTVEALRQRLAAALPHHFAPHERTRVAALVQRYVDYRAALATLTSPDLRDPQALREAVAARRALRARHFDAAEQAALFADDEALERLTLARLEIARHPSLAPAEKAAALRAAEADLPAAQRTERQRMLEHLAVAAHSAALDAAGADAQTRHRERAARWGEEAAARLAELDRQEQDWQARLAQYAALRAAGTAPDLLQIQRQRLFTPEEQLRLDAALQLRATAGSRSQ